MSEATSSNTPELSVTELSNALKRTVEDRFGYVRVRGEVSGYRGAHASGHVYFSLKDQGARLDAIIWKMAFARMKVKPEEGLEVIATGKLTTYPGKSSYQIVIETLEPAGVGALMALLEERRRVLAAEGLFDAARKRPIPYLPEVIGVVTSPTGAVIRDILHRLQDRFPRPFLVWPVRVQGDTSGSEVAAAIAGFNALAPDGPIPRPSVLIVARGGGSLEDLWGFNDEVVVRAVAESTIPVISAVGHETDTTLIDHVSDLRAPTPTGAAEMAVPVRSDLIATLADLAHRQHASTRRALDQRGSQLRALARVLPNADAVLAQPRQQLDRTTERLFGRFQAQTQARHLQLGRLGARLARHSPQAEMARRRARLDQTVLRLPRVALLAQTAKHSELARLSHRLTTALQARKALGLREMTVQRNQIDSLHLRLRTCLHNRLSRSTVQLQSKAQLLSVLGYKNVLDRGYALILNDQNQPVRSAKTAQQGDCLAVVLADGQIDVVVQGDDSQALEATNLTKSERSKARSAASKPKAAQGFLF